MFEGGDSGIFDADGEMFVECCDLTLSYDSENELDSGAALEAGSVMPASVLTAKSFELGSRS